MTIEGKERDTEASSPESPVGTNKASNGAWPGTTRPSLAIVNAIAEATETDPFELPPLQQSIEVDALDALLTAQTGSEIAISFSYAGRTVTVEQSGEITLD